LDQTVDVLQQFFPSGYGIRNARGQDVERSTRVRKFYTVRDPRTIVSRPFLYDVYLYLSHEPSESAGGQFRSTSSGGHIILFTNQLSGQSPEAIASLLVHEIVHMFSDMRRKMGDMRGAQAAARVPTSGASALLDPRAVATERQPMEGHFERLIRYLNAQDLSTFDDFPVEETADRWADLLVEEVLAYLFSDTVEEAVATYQAQQQARSGGPGVGVTPGSLVPMRFLKNYLTEFWIHDPQHRTALNTAGATRIIEEMEPDLRALVNAVRQRFAGSTGSPSGARR
jgi:hypothetical protein